MYKIFLHSLSIVVVMVGTSTAWPAEPQTTLLGVFHPESPASAKALGATCVRLCVPRKRLTDSRSFKKVADYKRAGLTVIVTLIEWNPNDTSPIPPKNSPEWISMFDQFEEFVRAAGPSIDFLALGNEPTVDMMRSDYEAHSDGTVPAIDLFQMLASRAKSITHGNPSLAHMKVTSPAILSLQYANNTATGRIRDNMRIFEWAVSDPNIDAIDIHAHVIKPSKVEDALRYLTQHTRKPVIITEWSQAAVAWSHDRSPVSWLDTQLAPAFVEKWKLPQGHTNGEFIKACYKKPIGKTEWDDFVATAPYDATFMKEAFAIMVKYNVSAATYAAQLQMEDFKFDTKNFLADRTVVKGPDGKPQESYYFATWFRELASSSAGVQSR